MDNFIQDNFLTIVTFLVSGMIIANKRYNQFRICFYFPRKYVL